MISGKERAPSRSYTKSTRRNAIVQILNQNHLVMLFVVNHLVNHLAGDEYAEAAGAQSFFFAHARVLEGIALGVKKGCDCSLVTIERLDCKAFARVFDAIENDARRVEVANFDRLCG